jgi:pimeloyl-ACP methyl ester carboxylesterase
VGTRACWHEQPDVAALIEHVLSMSPSEPVDPQFARDFQQSTLAQPVPPGWLEMAVAESLKLPARTWQAVCAQGIQEANLTGLLGRIRARTLLLCGELDTLARDGQQALLEGIEDAQLKWYAGTGHALHWEEPVKFADDVAGFVCALGTGAGDSRSARASEAVRVQPLRWS